MTDSTLQPPPSEESGQSTGRPHADALTERLARIEALLAPARGVPGGSGPRPEPAWRRVTRGEPRWASTAAVVVVVVIQLVLPARMAVHPRWLLPAVETVLLLALIAGNPHRIERASRAYRALSLALTLVIGGANAYSAVRLVAGLVRGTEGSSAGPLLLTGGAIWLINIVIFALVYWELDRGGPAARAAGEHDIPDFLFVQMQSPELAPPHWEPAFFDYFYLSFTNSTAFSPTDVMPSTRWAKALMLGQSAVSLLTVVLVVARAVNILR
ncbi:DUF1345 domain-containing protein [Actinacidiphila acidipaludis]|uniref:DUF1345 domain-containing protein n=1 Tax=Actinacidiphila acidipaludis TaxID=2873382 RepID=UPI0027E0F600|nr:DUF1345 domain-containing protein [Streptomyces acidipaludis]